jgi:hypothetical protein
VRDVETYIYGSPSLRSLRGCLNSPSLTVGVHVAQLDVKRKYIDLKRQLSTSEAEKLKQAEYMEVRKTFTR